MTYYYNPLCPFQSKRRTERIHVEGQGIIYLLYSLCLSNPSIPWLSYQYLRLRNRELLAERLALRPVEESQSFEVIHWDPLTQEFTLWLSLDRGPSSSRNPFFHNSISLYDRIINGRLNASWKICSLESPYVTY
jgi:hypothetical protein